MSHAHANALPVRVQEAERKEWLSALTAEHAEKKDIIRHIEEQREQIKVGRVHRSVE